ncbi:peptidylprolyl isomerase [Gordonia phthalatica]|uniref:Peptidylprolyl isomerase n=1 Tax=Gordonia phthalatica TaxID=1136941 RepID=A0A0N9NB49_9ACTN|nr:peptidylprolyl isomerase [Gordonia phthalatica]ALG84722.1 peptidylprolyl isomerase [Gordonia phthalatica]
MSSNEERREAARRKLEERLESERRAARQRKLALISVCSVAVLAAVAVGGYFYYRHWDNERHTTCEYVKADHDLGKAAADYQKQLDAAKPNEITPEQRADAEKYIARLKEGAKLGRTAPKPGDRTLNTGTVDWTLDTNLGNVPIALDRASAPCNVNAVISLSDNKFYDNTKCHRLAQGNGVFVLQCGDPTLTSSGGPGWSSPDEDPTDLKEGTPVSPQMVEMGMQGTVVYPRGTVAIANRNNAQQQLFNTGSSQFFIVTKDTELQPNLAVVGKVSPEGMKVIDKVVAGGIDPGPRGSAEDGTPKTPLEIKKASVSED